MDLNETERKQFKHITVKVSYDTGLHVGFLESRDPNFEIWANVQVTSCKCCTHRKKPPEYNPIYFLILPLPQKLNTCEYKPMCPCFESSLFIG